MNKITLKISIVIVTYNEYAKLEACLKSIFKLPGNNIEVIIIDGCSTDGTLNIIKQNSSQIAYWQSEPDDGIYDAMNKAFKHVQSDWIYFMGADDELLPEFSEMINHLNDSNTIYYGNVLANKVKMLGKLTTYQLAKFGIYHQAAIFPKSAFSKHRYNVKYKISADYALLLELFGTKKFKFVYLNYILAQYDTTGLSSHTIDSLFQRDKAYLILKNFGVVIAIRYFIHRIKNRKNPRA